MGIRNDIGTVADPAARLSLLHTCTTTALLEVGRDDSPVTAARKFAFHDTLALTRQAIADLRQGLVTAEQSGLLRSNVDDLVRCLSAMLFIRLLAMLPGAEDGQAHLEMREMDEDDRAIITGFRALLNLMVDWRLELYGARSFHAGLSCLAIAEQELFRRLSEDLARMLWQSFKEGPRVRRSEAFAETLSRAREIRTLAQAELADQSVPIRPRGEAEVSVFVLEVLPSPYQAFGIIGFEGDRIHLWWSQAWTLAVEECGKLLRNLDIDSDRFDALALATQKAPEYRLERMLGGRQTGHISLHNLTASLIPYDCFSDDGCGTIFASGKSRPARNAPEKRISFWGEMKYRLVETESVDPGSRLVLHAGKTILKYPILPAEPVVLKGAPSPLPFAHYERWFFEDLARGFGVPIDFNTGRAATRRTFLEHDWAETSVLHITTHGHADSSAFEVSNLMFAEEDDSPTRVHGLDIMARDWSQFELVFLNACLTEAGKKVRGERALSLAWTFLAAGARAVIGYRWQVEDSLAWFFARRFYETWLVEKPGLSVREAFAEARRAVRQQPRFGRPSQWGAIVLIT